MFTSLQIGKVIKTDQSQVILVRPTSPLSGRLSASKNDIIIFLKLFLYGYYIIITHDIYPFLMDVTR